MPKLLPPVLSSADLPEAELHAARLDGEVYAVDECFGPVDGPVSAELRGAALRAILPPRLIAERRTAAWVHGALESPPLVHELCADSAARYRCLGAPRLTVREVVLGAGDTRTFGGMRVTTALRTAIDIARFSTRFSPDEQRAVDGLAAVGRFGIDEARSELDRRGHLPHKLLAASRLAAVLGD